MRNQFENPSRTYKTYENAKKVIDKLEDGDYSWMISVTKDGRYFPVIIMSMDNKQRFSHFYFIKRGCCVQMI